MKARSRSEIEGMAKTTKSHPEGRGWTAECWSPNARRTWWCGPCRKSFKRGMRFGSPEAKAARLKDLEERGLPPKSSACPLCHGPLECSNKIPVPWSKRGKRRARLVKYLTRS